MVKSDLSLICRTDCICIIWLLLIYSCKSVWWVIWGYVAAVYVIAVLCALISHYLVDDTVAHIFNKKKPSIDEVKEEVQIEEKQIVKQPVSVADDDETDFKKTEQSVFFTL